MDFRDTDLRTEHPLWEKELEQEQSQALQNDVRTEVVVMGGGITGALVAFHLSRAGIDTVLVERKRIGGGSTCASTALLQYEIDTPLNQLIHLVGREEAERCYLMCRDAIYELGDLCETMPNQAGFEYRPSLYYASSNADKASLWLEYQSRKRAGIDVEILDRTSLTTRFPFNPALELPLAIWSKDGAQVDAVQLTKGLIHRAVDYGCRLYENTTVEKQEITSGGVTLQTDGGFAIRARKVVIASGYEGAKYVNSSLLQLNHSFALCSEPIATDQELWHRECMIWETARPYYYLRTTPDHRVMVGGGDVPFDPKNRMESMLEVKKQELKAHFNRLFPHIPLDISMAWGGVFAETSDGLPYIGSHPDHPNTYFALGFGGNGILFSHLAAKLITNDMLGSPNTDAELFSFDR